MYRYSTRLASWASGENRFTTLLAKARADGLPLLDLTVSNPTEALTDYPHSRIAAAFGAIPNFRYQPEPFGHPHARLHVAQYLARHHPTMQLSSRQIALTASTSEAYSILFKLLANDGDEILVPAPSYPLFEFLAGLEGVKLRPYQLRYDGSWYLDFASLKGALSPRTRALIVVNPNNPTGSYLQVGEFESLCAFCAQHALPVISDEVFVDYAFQPSEKRVLTFNGRNEVLSFALNGLSKGAGMPQMKLGWIAVNGPESSRLQALDRLELILDTYLSVGAPVQLAIGELLSVGEHIQHAIRARIASNLTTLDQMLVGQAVSRLHTEGGWSTILQVPQTLTEDEWITRLLLEKAVITQPGYFFDMPQQGAYLVVSLLTPEDQFRQGLTRICHLVHG